MDDSFWDFLHTNVLCPLVPTKTILQIKFNIMGSYRLFICDVKSREDVTINLNMIALC